MLVALSICIVPAFGIAASPPDSYEAMADNSAGTFNLILQNERQSHTLHDAGDEDWVRFQVLEEGLPHTVRLRQHGDIDAVLEIHFEDGSVLTIDDEGPGSGAEEIWTSLDPPLGVHLLRIRGVGAVGTESGYTVEFTGDWGESVGIGQIGRGSVAARSFSIPRGTALGGSPSLRGGRNRTLDSPCALPGLYPKTTLSGDAGTFAAEHFVTVTAPWDLLNPDAAGEPGTRPWTAAWSALHPLNATVTEIVFANADFTTPPPNSFSPPLELTLEMMDDTTAWGGAALIDDIPIGSNCGSATVYVWNGTAWAIHDGSPTCDAPGRTATTTISSPLWVDTTLNGIASKAMIFAVVPTGVGTQPTPTPCPTATPTPTPGPSSENEALSIGGSGSIIAPARYSTDGDTISFGSGSGVSLYDRTTGGLKRRFPLTVGVGMDHILTTDGTEVLFSNEGEFSVSKFETTTALPRGSGSTSNGAQLSAHPGGEYFWVAGNFSFTQQSELRRVEDFSLVRTYNFPCPPGGHAMAWYDGGAKFAIQGDGQIALFDTTATAPFSTGPGGLLQPVAVGVSHDETLLFSQTRAGFSNQVLVYTIASPTMAVLRTEAGHNALAVSPNRAEYVTLNNALNRIELKRTTDGFIHATFPYTHLHPGTWAEFHPSGDEVAVAAAGTNGEILVLTIERSGPTPTGLAQRLRIPVGATFSEVDGYSRDFVVAAPVLNGGPAAVLSTATGRVVAQFGNLVACVAVAPQNKRIGIVDMADGSLSVRTLNPSAVVWNAAITPADVVDTDRFLLALNGDGTRAVVAGRKSTAPDRNVLYTFAQGTATPIRRTVLASGKYLTLNDSISVSRDGAMYAVGFVDESSPQFGDGFLAVGPMDGSADPTAITYPRGAWDVAFSPATDRLAITEGYSRFVRIYDTAGLPGALGAPLLAIDTGDTCGAVAFSKDGLRFWTTTEFADSTTTDYPVTLRTVATGAEVDRINLVGQEINVEPLDSDDRLLVHTYRAGFRVFELAPPRAVIVAGGGNFPGNGIAQQTDELAAYAYRVLKTRGYDSTNIQYLSAFGTRDADGDGLNDVDDAATYANLVDAIGGSFGAGAGRLLILMIDHGYSTESFTAFRINTAEAISTTQLDAALDALQTANDLDVTLVVDSCYSGRFVTDCAGSPGTGRRIVVSSTTEDSEAVFMPPPDLSSFMNQFLGSTYMGNSIGQAYQSAVTFFQTFSVAQQEPQIDDGGAPGLDVSNFDFVGATWTHGVQPSDDINVFHPVFDYVTTSTVELAPPIALVARTLPGIDPIAVTAVVRPPASAVVSGDPIAALPVIPLVRNGGDPSLWEATGTETHFSLQGAHVVTFVAQLPNERLSNPSVATITISGGTDPDSSPMRGLIVCGDSSIASLNAFLQGIRPIARTVYVARFQDSNGVSQPSWVRDYGAPAKATVLSSIDSWVPAEIPADGTFFLHLAGQQLADGSLRLNGTETLSAAELDTALDALQTARPAVRIVAALDFSDAPQWMADLAPTGGQQRVVLYGTGTAQNALFLADAPYTSFSQKLLSSCYQGNTLRDGFRAARNFLRVFTDGATVPLLEDNGDGVANKMDGALAGELYLGRRYAFAGDDPSGLPFILDVTPPQTADPGDSRTFEILLLRNVAPTAAYVQVRPPNSTAAAASLPKLPLSIVGGDPARWSIELAAPLGGGTYVLSFYAVYPDGAGTKLSEPAFTTLTVSGPPAADARGWMHYE